MHGLFRFLPMVLPLLVSIYLFGTVSTALGCMIFGLGCLYVYADLILHPLSSSSELAWGWMDKSRSIIYYVEEALRKWEPRLQNLNVEVDYRPEEESKVMVKLEYQVIATNNVFNLVYPFYLQRGETV